MALTQSRKVKVHTLDRRIGGQSRDGIWLLDDDVSMLKALGRLGRLLRSAGLIAEKFSKPDANDPSKRVRRKRGTVRQGSMCSVAEGYSDRRAKGSRAAAYPEPIGLKSNIRLSGVLVNSFSVTSSDVSTHLRPAKKARGAGPSLGHRLARSPDHPTGAPSQPKRGGCSKRLVRTLHGSARNWIAGNAV
jgi:hypothetical protein